MLSTQSLTIRALAQAEILPVFAYTKAGKLLGVYGTRDEAETAHHNAQLGHELTEADAAEHAAWEAANPAPAAKLPRTSAGKVDRYADRLRASSLEKPVARVHAYVYANPGKARKDLIAELVASGIAFYTARTQVQAALKAGKENPELFKQAEELEEETE